MPQGVFIDKRGVFEATMRIYCEIRRLEATLRISREIGGSVHDRLMVLSVGNNNIYREKHGFP